MSTKRSNPPQPEAKTVLTSELQANPHNPRRLFDRIPMDALKHSIAKVGILVPLTVYWSKDKQHYVILDGQRRWMCAQELHIEKVPINQVAEPSLVQNIVTMFQIHKLREDWELMPTALKLEILMNELNERNDKSLATLTGLDQAVVTRCKKLLSYDKKYQDMMLHANPEQRVKADFFIELYPVINDRSISKLSWFKKSKFIENMLEKYTQKFSGLKAVTDFRTIKQHTANARKAGKDKVYGERLKEYMESDDLPLDHLIIKSADITIVARKVTKQVEDLADRIRELEPDEYYGEEKLWVALETLLDVIKAKLKEADRRPK